MAYDERDRRLVIFGGWNNGCKDDLYTLTVAKIVGPSYAIVSSDPDLGQLSGNVELKITGRGFKELSISVLFTQGNKPVDQAGKLTLQVPGTFISETELTCITPNFEQFGPKECVMQLCIGNGDLTTTWIPFQYFLNTRANKSLAYGPGILQNCCAGTPVEFVIVARNDLNENRTSGRDKFVAKVKKEIPKPEDYEEEEGVPYRPKFEEIECDLHDNQDGTYKVQYKIDEEIEVEVHVLFEDDKGNMVQIRGSPYKASFSKNAKPNDNLMAGPLMQANFKA